MEQQLIPMGNPSIMVHASANIKIIVTIKKLIIFKYITRLGVWGYSIIQKGLLPKDANTHT